MDTKRLYKAALVLTFGLLCLLSTRDTAMAVSAYLTGTNATNPGFNTVYPNSKSSANPGPRCAVCHFSTGGGDDLNAYGNAWALQHNTGITTRQAFVAVETLNSDSDPKGVTNIREINASSQPGWTPGPNNTLYDVLNPGTVAQTCGAGTSPCDHENPPALTGNLDPAAKVAVFRSSNSTFYLDANGNGAYNGCVADSCAAFGSAGDIPLLGDWSGIGTARVGVFRPSTGTFYLDYNGNNSYDGCATDKCIGFGESGDIPLVGDWSGDGTTKIGVYRPSNGTFYLDFNGNGLWDGCGVDKCITGGNASDIPLVGDWNGSGTTKVGVFRPSIATFVLDYNGDGTFDGCVTDKCIAFGVSTDTPFVGDWNGDGKAKVGVYRSSDLTFYLDFNGNGLWNGCATDKCVAFGSAGDAPLVGDWNSDGKTKVGAFRPSAGTFYLDYNGDGFWNGCATDKCVAFGSAGDTPLIANR